MTDFNKILNRSDYSRLVASVKDKCEEVAKVVRKKMEELDIPNDPNYYYGEVAAANDIIVRVVSKRSNVGTYDFLAIKGEEEDGDSTVTTWHSLEDINKDYYYGGDFTARIIGANSKEALRFLNAAGDLVKSLDLIEDGQVQRGEDILSKSSKPTAEKLNRGYVTYALTDGDRKIFGLIKDCFINEWSREASHYYWSEVYVEPGYMATIIRKGQLLVEPTNEKLSELHAKSKINLGVK